jgi:DNA repair protein RadD
VAAGYSVCPDCGHEFFKRESDRQAKHDAAATAEGILSGEVTDETCAVKEVRYSVHIKRNALPGAPRTMRVEYRISLYQRPSEWVCFEHAGFARHKAELWWRRRSILPVPQTVEDAVSLAEAGALAETKSITVRHVSGEEYGRIIGYELGERPAYREPGWDEDVLAEQPAGVAAGHDDEEIPF